MKIHNISILGIGNGVSAAIYGILWLILATLLTIDDFGELNYIIAVGGIAFVISFLGSGNTIIVYTAKEGKIQSSIYFVAVISGLITSIILYFIFSNFYLSLFLIGAIIFALLQNELIGKKLYRKYVKFTIFQRSLALVLTVIFYFLIGPQGVILGFAASFFPFYFLIFKKLVKNGLNRTIIKSRFTFMIHSYSLDLSRKSSLYLDKLIIFPIFGFALLGNYQLGIQLLMILSILPNTIYQYVLSQDSSGKSTDKIKKFTILISVILSILGYFLGPKFISVLFPKFLEAIELIPIISLAITPITISLMYNSQFLSRDKSRIVLFGSSLFLFVQITGIILFSNIYGIMGAVIALLLASIVQAAYLFSVNHIVKK